MHRAAVRAADIWRESRRHALCSGASVPASSLFALSEPPLSAGDRERAEAETLPPPPPSRAERPTRELPKVAPAPRAFAIHEEVSADLSRDSRAEDPAPPAVSGRERRAP
jgi:hypothetical protein